jgi:hypothetical protein
MKKYGKLPVRHDERSLMFSTYSAGLPTPPVSTNHLQTVFNNLKTNNIAKLFPMLGNDQYGDCTIAGLAHLITLYNGLIGVKKIPSKSSVLTLYKKLTGGPDTGLNELDVLNYICKNSFDGEKTPNYVTIKDHTNHLEVKQAISLVGGIYIGMNVQENAETDFDAHKTWTPGKLTGDDHCVVIVDYDDTTLTILTWGGLILGTWDWFDCTCDEIHPILPLEAKNIKFNPQFPYDQLVKDLSLIK